MGVLLLHQVHVLVFKFVGDQDALGSVAKLDKGLQDAAAVMLEAQLDILLADCIDALLDDRMLVRPRHLFLLHEKAIVRNLPEQSRQHQLS